MVSLNIVQFQIIVVLLNTHYYVCMSHLIHIKHESCFGEQDELGLSRT